MAAEYVLKEGNEAVMLCERGIRTFETAYRFTLDLMAVPVLKEMTHLPVIVDPSHAAGRRDLVTADVAGCGGRGRRRDHRRGPSRTPTRRSATPPSSSWAIEFADYLDQVQAAAAVAGQDALRRHGRWLT